MFFNFLVTSTYQEPMVGWIDNLYGPTGVVAGAGKMIKIIQIIKKYYNKTL